MKLRGMRGGSQTRAVRPAPQPAPQHGCIAAQTYEIDTSVEQFKPRAVLQGNGTIRASTGRPSPSREPVNESHASEHPPLDDRVEPIRRSSLVLTQPFMISMFRRRAADVVSACLPQRYRHLPQETAALSTRLEQLSAQVQRLTDELTEQLASVDRGYQGLLERLAEMSRLRGEDRAELTTVAARVRLNTDGAPTVTPQGHRTVRAGQPYLDSFYSGFEERFRGSRDGIEAKMLEYLPAIRAVERGDAAVLDVGPGRCEWLGLLEKEGILAYGVDTNTRFVELGASLGLDVRLGDAIEHLRELPDVSLAGVTAFQVAEHLPTALLFDLVDHALRTLRPGGVLILETPNPLNLAVGAAEFWIDPTHLRPLHPQFLEYLLINRGFVEVEVHTTNPPSGSFDLGSLGDAELRRLGEHLNHLLFTGGDYAVIGRRAASAE